MQTWYSGWMEAQAHHRELLERGVQGRLVRAASRARTMQRRARRMAIRNWATALLRLGPHHRAIDSAHPRGWEPCARCPSADETSP
jgi:hypothetical protein